MPEAGAMYRAIEPLTDEQWAAIDRIDGWLSRTEAECLHRWNQTGNPHTRWVEVGSWKGRSTRVLALHGQGFAVDHFVGSSEHPAGTNTWTEWAANLAGHDNVTPLALPYVQAVGTVRLHEGLVHLLFLDAEHTYEATKEAFELYSPLVHRRGVVIIHDAWADDGDHLPNPWHGVTRFVEELLEAGVWVEVEQVARCSVLRRAGQ